MIEEETLLREIENLYDKLKQNKNGTYIGSCKIGEPGFCYKLYADELLKKVRKLYFSFHPDYLDESDIADFMHTIDKEVCYVDSLYQEVIKPNATKKKKAELDKAINKANNQIKLDLHSLLNKSAIT